VVPVWQDTKYKIKEITHEDGKEFYELDPRPKGLKAIYMRRELLNVS
jgi:hypothetical protein